MAWIADFTEMPQEYVASATLTANAYDADKTPKPKQIIGVCQVKSRPSEWIVRERTPDGMHPMQITLLTTSYASMYMYNFKGKEIIFNNYKVKVIQPPKHGILIDDKNAIALNKNKPDKIYIPNDGYNGKEGVS